MSSTTESLAGSTDGKDVQRYHRMTVTETKGPRETNPQTPSDEVRDTKAVRQHRTVLKSDEF